MLAKAGQRTVLRALRVSDDIVLPLDIEVVSRFRHTAMAYDGKGDPVTLLVQGKLAGPRSVVVECLPDAAGFAVLTSSQEIDGPDRSCCETVPCTLAAGQPPFSERETAAMETFLRRFAPAHSLWRAVQNDAGSRNLIERHWMALCRCQGDLPDISGYGAGLTPSTDDYLLGMLAVGHAMGYTWHGLLVRSVSEVLPGCSPVSRMMLSQALCGRFPEVIVAYFEKRDHTSLIDFVRHGSSSGFDIVFGLLSATHGERGIGL